MKVELDLNAFILKNKKMTVPKGQLKNMRVFVHFWTSISKINDVHFPTRR